MKSALNKIIVKIAATIFLIAAIFYFLIMPRLNQLVQNQVAIEKISSDLSDADAKLAQLKKLDKGKADLNTTKTLVDSYLPDDPSASSFIVNMEQTSSQIPVIIDALSVSEIKVANAAKTTTSDDSSAQNTTSTTAQAAKPAVEKALGFSATFKAPYSQVILFFKKMEEMQRFNTIEKITVNNYDRANNTVSLKAEGKIYYGK